MRSVAISTRFTPCGPQPASPKDPILSTMRNIPRRRDRIRARPGIGLALTALFAIGLALLILMPAGRSTGAPGPSRTARPAAEAAAFADRTLVPAGCFRDPTTQTLTCVVMRRLGNRLDPAQATTYYVTAGLGKGAASLAGTLVPAGCFRDPTNHTLTCVVLRRLANRLNPVQTTTFYATG